MSSQKKQQVAGLSHLNSAGEANMVDVSDKSQTVREARAEGTISMSQETLQAVADNAIGKGEVLAVARIAGIQAAKKCSDLIPLCHPLMLAKVSVEFEVLEQGIRIEAMCKLSGQTGVEMEALTAVSVAALTIYDMCKAMDKGMIISEIGLLTKTGGKSGDWHRAVAESSD